ncbi:phosphatidylglycerol lysyltransferase [Candidatus Phycosocius bacilliformis]|uniref:Phosphatidylglycerol lysyltransferase n=1 Tax=Candidatus Phycosocius bacilliformis TaxID=1445552 RepID=A0A2P2E8M3_9PROT|nr:bifunctional lysylphosphatidylglycerol flippase/synthetase MprF [Candidatus Phycosocius bacilliformis]GBF57405.1 phosphatidylglycerol lysyltransferase [Candidatus Phycosocius bacilliformis]
MSGFDDDIHEEPGDDTARSPVWLSALALGWARLRGGLTHPLATAGFSLIIFGLALWLIHTEMTHHSVQDLTRVLNQVSPWTLLVALACVGLSYLALAANDRFVLNLLGKSLPRARTARASIATYALANSLGYSWVTAGTARQRLYRKWGLQPSEIGALSFLTGSGVQIGGLSIAGLGLLVAAPEVATHGPLSSLFWYGLGLLLCIPGTLWLIYARRGPLRAQIGGASVHRPELGPAARHLLLVAGEWVCAAAVLYVLLPDHGGWSFPAFLAVYVLAGLLGALSGSPGGLGIFEAAILTFAPITQDTPGAAVALVLYRLLYTFVPLVIGTIILGLDHATPAARPATEAARKLGSTLSSTLGARLGARVGLTLGEATLELSPRILATLVFAAGLVLLASVATPAMAARMQAIDAWDLRAISDLSHFATSIIGVLLLLVASGLWRKVAAAWGAAIILLTGGIVFSLAKGLDWEEASILTVILLLTLPCGPAFTRKSALGPSLLSPGWIAALLGAVAAAAWLALFTHQNVDFRTEMWWDFVRDADAARSLRALTAASVITLFATVAALLTPWRAQFRRKSAPEELALIEDILAHADSARADANLAFLGDKQFVFSRSNRSFVMYRPRGNRWVIYGDPIGQAGERQELIASVREAADQAGARPIYYAISRDVVPDFAEAGYVVRKIGETAIVELADFSLSGKAAQNLRTARNRLQREGMVFNLAQAAQTPALLDEMEPISTAWLKAHHGGEKTFSLGSFDRAYLSRFPTAYVRDPQGQMVAFASLWTTADGQEIAIDLMRHRPDGPNGVMDFLFVEIALWAQANGYQRFDLAMAPLSGLQDFKGAPLLARLGAIVFEEGEAVYGFRGLRRFKDKFNPTWKPLYLCAPPDVMLPAALLDVAALTSGGLRAMVKGSA